MTKSVKDTKDLDDELADFTDRVLSGGVSATSLPSGDEELLGLEKTVLSLSQSFPHYAMNQATIKRMQADINIRRRKIDAQPRTIVWWSRQTRQRFGLALAVIVLALAGILIIPSFSTGSGISASAGLHPLGVGLLVLLVVVLPLIVWFIKSHK